MSTPSAPRAFRAVPLVLGSITALVAVALLLAGALALWAHETQRDADGYLNTPTELLATPTFALVSEAAQIDVGPPSWFFAPERFGTIRVHAEGPHGEAVFIGIAAADDVDSYLAGVRYDEVADIDRSPLAYRRGSVVYRRHEGGALPGEPAAQGFWIATAAGSGEQVVSWRPTEGSWRIVALQPDGSAGVEAYVSFGARVSFLGALAWTLLALGGVLLVIGGVLIAVGSRAAPAAPAAPPTVDVPPAPPPVPRAREGELAGVGADREEQT